MIWIPTHATIPDNAVKASVICVEKTKAESAKVKNTDAIRTNEMSKFRQ